MLERPDISDDTIARHIRSEYGLDVRSVEFLALGADQGAAAFRVECAVRVVFAKLRYGTNSAAVENSVALLAFLAKAGPTRVLAPIIPAKTGQDRPAFYQGYGTDEPDPLAIAYYRCERIVEDSALFCADLIPGGSGSGPDGEDRAQNLRYLLDQFQPGSVIDCADAAYARYLRSAAA